MLGNGLRDLLGTQKFRMERFSVTSNVQVPIIYEYNRKQILETNQNQGIYRILRKILSFWLLI